MRDIINQILPWVEADEAFVLATIIKTWGSAPRKVGAHMAISSSGDMIGSVSGGCVEGDVVKRALELLLQGGSELVHYGVSDENAWAVGLSCGGKIDVFLETIDCENASDKEFCLDIEKILRDDKGAVVLRRLEDDDAAREIIYPDASDSLLHRKAAKALNRRSHSTLEFTDQQFFAEVIAPRSKLIIIGVAHIAVDLVHLASQFGFETILIDPRGFFSDNTQFITAPDTIHANWPEEVLPDLSLDAFTYAVTLSHNPQIDDQALHILLKSNVAYIGALGSRRTHAKRVARLQESGFNEEEINRIHAPIGVDIRASTAQEIALSILSEMISIKNQFL